jgi:hypothetical protein
MYSVTGVEKEIIAIFAIHAALKEGRSVKLPSDMKGFFEQRDADKDIPRTDIMFG